MDKAEVQRLVKKGWIKVWMVFDTQAVDKKLLTELLEMLLAKMRETQSLKVVESSLTKPERIKPVAQLEAQGVKKVYSQILEATLLAEDFESLVNATITFGPTAVEILEPEKITISMRQAQNALSSMTEMMHRYAAAGPGGVMLTHV